MERFRHVTLPGIRNILIIVMLLSTIWTFNDFAIVYILTKGGPGGATMDDLRLMRRAAPPHVKLKAAGGIRTLDGMIEAAQVGCDRVGASRTAEILDELKSRLGS